MLKILLNVLLLGTLGGLVYDISQTGSFQKSNTYKYLNDVGAIKHGETLLKEFKKTFKKASDWAEMNVPEYYNEVCTHSKPYIDLGYNLILLFKSNTISLISHTSQYLDKNFPHFQESVNVMVTDTVSLAKKSLVMITDHVQNYTVAAVEYANTMLGS